jgi:hypothetical protein
MQIDIERLLARLLTDRAFRERFLADPAEVSRQEGLSPEEAKAAARIPAQDLRTAARSYQHKREANARQRGARRLRDWLGIKWT